MSKYWGCEVKTLELKDILLPAEAGKQQAVQQRTQGVYHLCRSCFQEIEADFKIKD